MLHVVTGPLYGNLEDALAEDLQSFRSDSPFSPLTIVVPSEYVRLRLQWALCAERSLSLFHVHILTFYQLALRILEEQGSVAASVHRSDSFFHQWIHSLLLRRKATLPELARLIEMPGAWAALWSTIKDLKDGAVDAELARDALKQSGLDHDPICQSVLKLYDWFLQEQQQTQIFDHDDAARMACADVVSSTYLAEQGQVWYYGFYDLTQVQLDLFHAVAQHYPTSVYFPVVRDHPAYHFAQQFFDRHILGLGTGKITPTGVSGEDHPLRALFRNHAEVPTSQLEPERSSPIELPERPLPEKALPACQVIHVAGAEDEICFVAKEILRCVEEDQIPLREIGVVGRTLSGYEHLLPRIFQEHGIPFNTTMKRSLGLFPFVQTLLKLLALPGSDFQRDHVMDVFTSPYFRWTSSSVSIIDPQPDLWDRASRRLGVTKGFGEWTRFFHVLEKECGKQDGRKTMSKSEALSANQIGTCQTVLTALFEALQVFPTDAPYDVFVEHTLQLAEQFLITAPSATDRSASRTDLWGRMNTGGRGHVGDDAVSQAAYDQLEDIKKLSQVSDRLSFSEFVATVDRCMHAAMVPFHPTSDLIDGVWVLDAMAARGFSFRILFVVGVNDQVFPRHIQEDAFLRDPVRRLFGLTLGSKVPENVTGYQEEQLLFYLLVNSASEAVTLLTQRSDQHDRSTIPSWYITETQRCVTDLSVTVVPKRESQKRGSLPQYENRWLTPQETRLLWMLDRRLPKGPHNREGEGWAVVQRGVASLACQESSSPRLNRFDGVTGGLSEFWQTLKSRGLSPTALEHYAVCPFKFFARQVLKLEALGLSDMSSGVGPRDTGNLLHLLLRECVEAFAAEDRVSIRRDYLGANMIALLTPVTDRVFQQWERWNPTGYPLLWELQQEQLIRTVSRVMVQDWGPEADDWKPVAFEQAITGHMRVILDNEAHDVSLTGRMDRVDWSASLHQSRIIDYKYKQSLRAMSSSQALARDVVRGKQLQPPLYLLMAEKGNSLFPDQETSVQSPTASCSGVWLNYMTVNAPESTEAFIPVGLTKEIWNVLKPQFETTMNTLVGGIHRGEYFMVPGDHCRLCDYRTICHRTHPMSRWRAGADRLHTKGHREVRYLKPNLPSEPSKATAKP
ncbi:MAG: PD-(D/E)XK nuclease family protein [Nitrospirae bacterium]|nr:PD-(D/E)XK nuclease family protein [Nitrospirota bacterium]MDA1304883.1 PD-(D/E)XK nuclease family protein [Nitrospirota bacterium]